MDILMILSMTPNTRKLLEDAKDLRARKGKTSQVILMTDPWTNKGHQLAKRSIHREPFLPCALLSTLSRRSRTAASKYSCRSSKARPKVNCTKKTFAKAAISSQTMTLFCASQKTTSSFWGWCIRDSCQTSAQSRLLPSKVHSNTQTQRQRYTIVNGATQLILSLRTSWHLERSRWFQKTIIQTSSHRCQSE